MREVVKSYKALEKSQTGDSSSSPFLCILYIFDNIILDTYIKVIKLSIKSLGISKSNDTGNVRKWILQTNVNEFHLLLHFTGATFTKMERKRGQRKQI